MKIRRDFENLHPILVECIQKIQAEIITIHSMPIRIFETARDRQRHQTMINKGITTNLFSRHLYYTKGETPMYCTAVDYVYFKKSWSWNLRDTTIASWYNLFGNLVLDSCPELEWSGNNRKKKDYTHFQLREEVIIENLNKYPCAIQG